LANRLNGYQADFRYEGYHRGQLLFITWGFGCTHQKGLLPIFFELFALFLQPFGDLRDHAVATRDLFLANHGSRWATVGVPGNFCRLLLAARGSPLISSHSSWRFVSGVRYDNRRRRRPTSKLMSAGRRRNIAGGRRSGRARA